MTTLMAWDKKQTLPLLALGLLLLSVSIGTAHVSLGSSFDTPVYIPWVWHNIGVYIYANGTVAPPDAPIQQSGNTYTLTGNIYIGLCIERNNSVFNGNGFQLLGNYYGTGLLLQNVNNVSVQNLYMQYFGEGQGVYFDHCNGSTVEQSTLANCGVEVIQSFGNTLSENNVGGEISVDYSDNNTLSGNTATAVSLSWSNDITVKDNHVANAALETTQLALQNYTEGVYVDNCANTNLSGNVVERENVGIDLWQNTNLTLTNNKLDGNQVGLKLWGSDFQHMPQNIDSSNSVNGKPVYYLINRANYQVPSDAGWIFAFNCSGITVSNWESQPNWDGLVFMNTTNSAVVNCTLSANFNAIHLENAVNCTITQNVLSDSNYAALYFEGVINCAVKNNEVLNNYCLFDIWHDSTNNTFLHNDFVGCNQTGPIENGTKNVWDDGTTGNYWSSFTGVDLNHDGVSDYPFLIDPTSGETDRYPLMQPINAQAFPAQLPAADENLLAMPQEYINYTLTNINGSLWAKIDGVYPMHVSSTDVESLPMLYPMPPNTTNIHVYLQGVELNWTDYSTIDPIARHHTDIGEWQMIYCMLTPVPSDFVLQIHYEHPVQIINGSYTFLYDLNISPYLSASSIVSTAHFNVVLPLTSPRLNVYRTSINGSAWQPATNVSTTNTTQQTVTFDVISQYNKPLMGDIAFVIGSSTVPEFPGWVILPLIALTTFSTFALLREKRRPNRKPRRKNTF
ncbi:MAG TPA: NosD domain-containing protein [Candidatus Nanoarchaeia archaeon]|nr:NosD domain-containing protein [Candidatus Nanoarchaeia archaeon]